MVRLTAVLALTFALLFTATPKMWADDITSADLIPIDPDDPEVIHMGSGVNTPCATGDAAGCQIYQGELNALTHNSVSIYMNGAGQPSQQNPILLILGI